MANPIILYDSILRRGVVEVTSTAGGYHKNNLFDMRAFKKWKATSNATQDITINLQQQALSLEGVGAGNLLLEGVGAGAILLESEVAGAESCDCIGIYNHNLGSIGATVKVYYENSGYQLAATITPTDDDIILSTFTTRNSEQWKIEISGANEAPYIGEIYLGARLTLPDPPDAPLTPVEESIRVASEIGDTGHLLGAVIQYYQAQINHSWTRTPNWTRTFYNTYFKPFWLNHARKLYPFFYAWDLIGNADDILFGSIPPDFVRREELTLLSYTDVVQLQMRGVL